MLDSLLRLVVTGSILASPVAPVRYRIDYSYNQVADLSELGGQVQKNTGMLSAYVTLTESDVPAGHQAEFRFDSVVVGTSADPIPNLSGDASAAKGVVYRSMIVGGRPVGGFKTTTVQTHANAFQSALDAIFPGFKTTAKVGDKWVDTTRTQDSSTVVKSNTTIVSWTASALADGLLTLDGAVTATGKTSQPMGENRLVSDATITGTRKITGTPGGAAVRGDITVKQVISATVEGADATFPGSVEQTVKITRLP